LEKMFMESNSGQERKNVKAYAKLFELWENIDSWANLKKADFSEKK
jgi:hypothetical protein